jgi:hypothetical protein
MSLDFLATSIFRQILLGRKEWLMRSLRTSFALLVLFLAVQARAQLGAYEWVTQSGRNNVLDSNPTSCDTSPLDPNLGWTARGEGCYDRSGRRCSDHPGQACDLQIVPKGRCSSGDPASFGCLWPRGAGHCVANTHVGCLSDAYAANPIASNAVTGASSMCAGTGDPTCDMTHDPYGTDFRADCQCDGTNPAAANFEAATCGIGGGQFQAVCSDGDPDRDTGGYGIALGTELNLGGGASGLAFPALGPAVNGTPFPSTGPRYPLENPPSVFEALRDPPGSMNRPLGATLGAIHPARTTNAALTEDLFAALGVKSQRIYGDSYWSDWTFQSKTATGTFNTHLVSFACNPPVGFRLDQKIDPTPGAPNSGDEKFCGEIARDGLALFWSRNLTLAERAANPTCPPTCKKDFDLHTGELAAIENIARIDANAGLQLALQSGEGRDAGQNDALSAEPLTVAYWLNTNDMRCRLGGWGNAQLGGVTPVGRCSDGPDACIPGSSSFGDAFCASKVPSQGGVCFACNGPITESNPAGLPIGYDTHGLPELDLVAGQRVGGVAGPTSIISLSLFVIGTTGTASAEFRDLPGAGPGTLDLADLGPLSPLGAAFGLGIGTGGTFHNGSTLPIGAPCCANGLDLGWPPEQAGTPAGPLLRTLDAGPGPDGIPGCFGDNAPLVNGVNACNQRLGMGFNGAKSDPQFDTGIDDVVTAFPSARFGVRGLASGFPTYNQVSGYAILDADVLGPDNTDGLVKIDMTHCPIHGGVADCSQVDDGCAGDDDDGDGVCNIVDNCPGIANTDQTDSDGDGVGNVCDNCVNIANPRVPADYLTTNTWATLTGGQRDDDHDGFGNQCDAKFVSGPLVNTADLTQLRASSGQVRTGDTCGTSGTRPCAIFDLDETGLMINSADLARFRLLNGKAPGPKCPSCPLICTAGTAGTCGPLP